MVTAEFTTDNGCICLRVTGHAGAEEKGRDIVCAACSILAYTVAQTLQYMFEEGELQKKPRLKLEDGNTVIIARPRKSFYTEALHTFYVAQVGYNLLAHSYPQYVTLVSFGASGHK